MADSTATSPPSGRLSAASLMIVLPISAGDEGLRLHLTALGGDARIPRDHGDAAVHRLLQRGHQRVGVVGRNGDGIDALGDQRVDDLDLAFGGGVGRAGVDDLDIAEFLGGFLRALVGGLEEADAERLDDQRDALGLGVRAAGDEGGGERRRRQGLSRECSWYRVLPGCVAVSPRFTWLCAASFLSAAPTGATISRMSAASSIAPRGRKCLRR